ANTLRDIIDYETINTAFSSVINVGMSFVIAFFSISFITFFFLKEDGLFYAMVKAVFPERYQENVSRALDKVTVLLSRYFSGLLAESLIIMVVISVVMIIFGMRVEDAFFIGLIMGVMNVIPYAGPVMGGIASLFIGIVAPISGYTVGATMLVIVATLLTVKGLDDFVLQPTLYSSRVKAHPLEVFLVILVAGSAAGVVGMLLAIPAYTVLRVFAKEFFSQFSLVKKLTENV
ncbi:MAG: AI-2E family transporter, partial [Alistipes sp.]|nr:AI-2E family transporter [Alistipes sp.]